MAIDTFDCAVIGAGPAGSAAAIALAKRGARVLLADAHAAPARKIGESLPPAARPLLQELGVLEQLVPETALPSFGNLSAWGSATLETTDFIFNPNGHGWQLDRSKFEALLQSTAQSAGATLWRGHVLSGAPRDTGGAWELELASGQTKQSVRAAWLIDATGRRRAVAKHLGATEQVFDQLVCVYAAARAADNAASPDADTRTLIEAFRDGWWYTALAPGALRVLAYLGDSDGVPAELMRDQARFEVALDETQHLRELLHRHGYRVKFPARKTAAGSSRLTAPIGKRWLAVGDAAAAYDPLSSQGMLTALATGLRAGKAVEAACRGDASEIGKYAAMLDEIWTRYAREWRFYYEQERRWPESEFWARRKTDFTIA